MARRLRPSTSGKFRRLLGQPEVVERYFRDRLRTFFPKSSELIECVTTHRTALSTSSYLTRYILKVREGRRFVQKHVRGNSIDRETWTIFRQLYKHRHSTLRSPRPLAYFTKPGYIFYEETGGDTLRQLPWQSSTWVSTMTRIGGALAMFQKTPVTGIRRLPWRNEERLVRGMAKNIAHHSPKRAGWITSVVKTLLQAERVSWKTVPGLVHKDFQASNIILGRPIGIIDFTLSGIGPRPFDLGTFAVHLGVMSLGHVSKTVVERRLCSFFRGYQSIVGPTEWKNIEQQLPVFCLRSAVDVLSITLTYLGEQSGAGKKYVEFLVNTINAQVRDIMTA